MLTRMWKPAAALTFSSSQRADLEALVRSGKTPQRGRGAIIVLAAADGKPINAIAQEFDVSRPTVYLWRERFAQAGLVGLLKDAPRPGRRPALTPAAIEAVVDATLHTTPADATQWSVRTMAKAQGLSHAVVHRIWRAHGLQPHRVETFKLSRDPDFVKSCAMSSASICIRPTRPWCFASTRNRRSRRSTGRSPSCRCARGFPRGRRTTTSGMARRTCLLRSTCWTGRSSPSALRGSGTASSSPFCTNSIGRCPSGAQIHLILDNYSTHTHPKVEAWFAAHPRYHRHFVPTSASWLNLVERWFAEITRKRIRRGTFRSLADLIRAIEEYVAHHNRHAQPFIWTATAATILRKVRHCKEALETFAD